MADTRQQQQQQVPKQTETRHQVLIADETDASKIKAKQGLRMALAMLGLATLVALGSHFLSGSKDSRALTVDTPYFTRIQEMFPWAPKESLYERTKGHLQDKADDVAHMYDKTKGQVKDTADDIMQRLFDQEPTYWQSLKNKFRPSTTREEWEQIKSQLEPSTWDKIKAKLTPGSTSTMDWEHFKALVDQDTGIWDKIRSILPSGGLVSQEHWNQLKKEIDNTPGLWDKIKDKMPRGGVVSQEHWAEIRSVMGKHSPGVYERAQAKIFGEPTNQEIWEKLKARLSKEPSFWDSMKVRLGFPLLATSEWEKIKMQMEGSPTFWDKVRAKLSDDSQYNLYTKARSHMEHEGILDKVKDTLGFGPDHYAEQNLKEAYELMDKAQKKLEQAHQQQQQAASAHSHL